MCKTYKAKQELDGGMAVGRADVCCFSPVALLPARFLPTERKRDERERKPEIAEFFDNGAK
jgi:hypothetical protein